MSKGVKSFHKLSMNQHNQREHLANNHYDLITCKFKIPFTTIFKIKGYSIIFYVRDQVE